MKCIVCNKTIDTLKRKHSKYCDNYCKNLMYEIRSGRTKLSRAIELRAKWLDSNKSLLDV